MGVVELLKHSEDTHNQMRTIKRNWSFLWRILWINNPSKGWKL